jgi:hypothetical protein
MLRALSTANWLLLYARVRPAFDDVEIEFRLRCFDLKPTTF